VEIVEMDDEELYVADDILEEASAAKYQIKSKLRCQKKLENFTSE
jgi:predicted DNA-binding protein